MPQLDPVSRRRFLVTVGIGAPTVAVLAACGGDDGGESASSVADTATTVDIPAGTASAEELSADGTLPEGFQVVQRWFPAWMTPGALRMPTSFADVDGLLPVGPATVTGRIVDGMTGDVVVDGLVGTRHQATEGAVPYWVFEATIEETGLYALLVEGGDESGAALQVIDAADVPVFVVGETVTPFDTPTVDDGRGVDPICTAEPECPLHEVTLTEALAAGKPVALLIGTPAFCQTGTCAPALESLVGLRDEYGDRVTMVHAEIYTDDTATVTSPIVQAWGLDYEPTLLITDADGVLVARLDSVFDQGEIRAALDLVA